VDHDLEVFPDRAAGDVAGLARAATVHPMPAGDEDLAAAARAWDQD
jgi:hypothetical protein